MLAIDMEMQTVMLVLMKKVYSYHELINATSVSFDRVPEGSFLVELLLQLTTGPAAGCHVEEVVARQLPSSFRVT